VVIEDNVLWGKPAARSVQSRAQEMGEQEKTRPSATTGKEKNIDEGGKAAIGKKTANQTVP